MTTAKNVMVIPARRRLGNTVQAEERPKLRVAAYCRVSTDLSLIHISEPTRP